jgi:hypothetical protein
MKTNKIEGRQVLDVQALAGTFKYADDTKLAGQTYRRFTYNGVVFTVNTEDKFCTDFDNDNLYAVTFGINEEGQFSKLAHNSQTQIENFARFESKLKAFDRIAVDANPEELATL